MLSSSSVLLGAVGFFEMIENSYWGDQLSEYNCIYCHILHTLYPKIVPEPLLVVVGVGNCLNQLISLLYSIQLESTFPKCRKIYCSEVNM
jgi:sorbitol-specific phosphotransferase system component IIC